MRPVLGSSLVIVGVAWIGAAVFDWDWVIHSFNNRLFLFLLGRTGTRILYAVGGVAFAIFGVLYAMALL